MVGASFGGQDWGAGDVWNKVKEKFGSKEGIRQNADIPLKTDNPMTNIEGSQRFDVRIQCPTKREGIKITFLPLPGNDYRLVVQQDLDLDGGYEYIYDTQSAGVRVSGVCFSGIVSCDPGGTWTNCQYFVWDAGGSGYITLVPVQDTSLLGGCFCSNSSCNVNTLAPSIMDFISGGISQAVMRARKDLAISKSGFSTSEMTARLYVQDREGCAYEGGTIYGELSPTHIYETQTPPDGTSYLIANPQAQDSPDSPYYLVSQASKVEVKGRSIGVPSVLSCDIRKDVALYTTDMYEDCSETWTDENGEVWCVVDKVSSPRDRAPSWGIYHGQCVRDYINCLRKNQDGACYYEVWEECEVESFGESCEYKCRITTDPSYSRYGITHAKRTFRVKVGQKYGIAFEPRRNGAWVASLLYAYDHTRGRELLLDHRICKGCSSPLVFAFHPAFNEEKDITIGAEWWANDWGDSWLYYTALFLKSQIYKGDQARLSQTNTCPTDDGCVIKNEWVCDQRGENCIQTIRDKVETGLSPQPICYRTNTQIGNYLVCAYGDRIEVRGEPERRTFTGDEMWFWVKREYECPSQEIDIDLTRYERVLSDPRTGLSDGEMSVADYSCRGKTCSYRGSHSANLGTPDSCPVAVCSVEIRRTDTSVFADRTNRSQVRGGAETTPLEMRTCEKRNGRWRCPVSDGEVVVEGCRCDVGLDSVGFSTSITTLQGVVDASKDIICSSVSP